MIHTDGKPTVASKVSKPTLTASQKEREYADWYSAQVFRPKPRFGQGS